MKFSATFLTLAFGMAGVTASPVTYTNKTPYSNDLDIFAGAGFTSLTRVNHWGAPKHPGAKGARPGWYYGRDPKKHVHVPCIVCSFP